MLLRVKKSKLRKTDIHTKVVGHKYKQMARPTYQHPVYKILYLSLKPSLLLKVVNYLLLGFITLIPARW